MAKRNLPLGGAIPMDPGERDQPVAIQQRAVTKGPSGFAVESWTSLALLVWMRRDDLKGHERFVAHQVSAPAETRWELGYRADMDPEVVDVTADRRLVHRGRVYDITHGSLIGARQGIELMTRATGAAP